MSKTYEMWAIDEFEGHVRRNDTAYLHSEKLDMFKNKVTITFHEERRVTITEEELEALNGFFESEGMFNMFKEKLFNRQD